MDQSYGSYLGATYANLFPGEVRAMVLDGIAAPTAWARQRSVRGVPLSTFLPAPLAHRCWLARRGRLPDHVVDRVRRSAQR